MSTGNGKNVDWERGKRRLGISASFSHDCRDVLGFPNGIPLFVFLVMDIPLLSLAFPCFEGEVGRHSQESRLVRASLLRGAL